MHQGSLIRNRRTHSPSFAFCSSDASTVRLQFVTLQQTAAATVCAPNTDDTDCQMNLDLTNADSIHGYSQGSISYETEERTKAEGWATADLARH